MTRIFYHHLFKIEEIFEELEKEGLFEEEKIEIINLIDEIFYFRTLTLILDKLPQEHHQNFLDQLHQSPNEVSILNFLREVINDDIEKLIAKEGEKIKQEIIAEIKKSYFRIPRK